MSAEEDDEPVYNKNIKFEEASSSDCDSCDGNVLGRKRGRGRKPKGVGLLSANLIEGDVRLKRSIFRIIRKSLTEPGAIKEQAREALSMKEFERVVDLASQAKAPSRTNQY